MAEAFVQSPLIRQSQLLEQIVLDRATMDEWGRIEVLWSYPKVHRVLGFICKSGRFDRTKLAFNLDQLDKVGENGVLVSSAPVETDRDRVQQLETLIGCEVWTDEGKKVGRINDYVFQLETGNIRHYLIASSGLQGFTGKLYSLYPNQILGYGRGRVMVSAGIVPGLELYQVGLEQKLEEKFTSLEERLESKLKRAADRVNTKLRDEQVGQTLQSGMQSWVDRARSVASEVKEQVRERAEEILEDDWRDGRNRRSDSLDWDIEDDRRASESRVSRSGSSARSMEPNVEFDFDDWDDESWGSEPAASTGANPNPRNNTRPSNPLNSPSNLRTTEAVNRPPLSELRIPAKPIANPEPDRDRGDRPGNSDNSDRPAFTAQPRPVSQRDVWDDDEDWV